MKTAHAFFFVVNVAVWVPAAAQAGRPGCTEPPEAAEAYVGRAQAAQAQGDHAKAADELWSAWCKSGDVQHLVGICNAQVKAQRPTQAQEIAGYAERRLAGQTGDAAAAARKSLQECKSKLPGAAPAATQAGQATQAGKPAAATPAPAAAGQKPAQATAQAAPTAQAGQKPVDSAQRSGAPSIETGPVPVTIQTVPAAAAVFVDGRQYGLLGTPMCIGLMPGTHTLRLEHAGHRAVEQTIRVEKEVRLDYTLQPGG